MMSTMTLSEVSAKLKSHAEFQASLGGAGELLGPLDMLLITDAIDAHLTSREAKGDEKPVAWQYRNVFRNEKSHKWHGIDKAQFDAWKANNDPSIELRELVVAHPSAQEAAKPVVQDEEPKGCPDGVHPTFRYGYRSGWLACRKAMLAAV